MLGLKGNNVVLTPKWLYDALDLRYSFTFDPCPVDPKFDGLACEWGTSNFVNPPYDDIASWIAKAIEERDKGKKSVFLIPVRPSRKYWFDLVYSQASSITLLEGGIKFDSGGDAIYTQNAPMPLAIVVFDPQVQAPQRVVFDALLGRRTVNLM